MFKKHVIKTFKNQWLKLLLVGFIIILSSFLYMIIGASVNAIHEGAEPFLKRSNQEDFSIELTPYLTEDEFINFYASCQFETFFLDELYRQNQPCYDLIVAYRFNQLNENLSGVELELRQYKETHYNFDNQRHKIRILKDAETINLSEIEQGRKPIASNEIALTRNYANNHSLSIGDSITILDITYEIVGFVLFPDYNLPVIEHMLLFDSIYQSLGLLSDEGFEQFNRPLNTYIAGVFLETVDIEEQVHHNDQSFPFVTIVMLTENNVRSGAIYAELEGGQATGLFLSGFIALIGIIIITIIIVKTIEKERGAIGVFKALGIKTSEMLTPYIIFISIYTLLFLTIGFILGYQASPVFRDLYLQFYLLPSVEPAFSWTDFFIAIFVPFLVIIGIGTYRLLRIMREKSITLLSPKIVTPKKVRFKTMKKMVAKLDIKIRLQVALLLRQFSKVITYSLSVFFALFLIFLSLSMREVFDVSLNSYYDNTHFESIAYCYDFTACEDNDYDKVIEMVVNIDQTQVTLIGLDLDNLTHPLYNLSRENITDRLSEGIIISKSYQDMYKVSVGDTLKLQIADRVIEREVVAVSNILLGAYVFASREDIALNIFGYENFFNALYSSERLSENDYPLVIHVEDILTQMAYTNELMSAMFFVMFLVALLIAVIVIYLLTALSIEDQTYEISLFSVLGYTKKEISSILLSGYFKLNVLIFIVVIPYTMLANYLIKLVMIDLFDYYLPLQMRFMHVIIAGFVSVLVFMLSSLNAKRKIDKRSLQESLKIYQM